ncbi:MAG: alpha/beta hydrolase, partial [Bacteroidales bacterium]|nr:alpha/beta hydrolase [Bacteroidales bacterium]
KNIRRNKTFEWKINLPTIEQNLGKIMDGLNLENFIDKKIELETLFLKAENSDYIKENDKKIIKFIFPNSKIIEIKNSSHCLHIDQPQKVIEEIMLFLNNNFLTTH